MLLGIIGISHKSHAQEKDYRTQVLFLYNFIKYISWPSPANQFVIGVVGDSPILDELHKLAGIRKTPDGKTIIIKVIENMNAVYDCNMIYLSDMRSKDIIKLVSIIQLQPALIVAERDGLAKKGAEINFFIQDDDKLGFSISRKNIEGKKLKVSGELLRLAELAD